jgi:predicted RNA binding protein YcfA (HicA-like mRNA interferase family)
MADRTIKARRLREILKKFGVEWNPRKGKGSHGSFFKRMDGGMFTYPVPDEKDVLVCYVRGCRKKFKLTAEDGIPDEQFYNA